MLRDITATHVSFDPSAELTIVRTGTGDGPFVRRTATLLLDAAGTLAGVDLRGPGGDGWVVMLGPHEDVASTEGGHSVDVASDETGKPSLVRVPGARPRGAEMSIL
jgi:hypothetical protein